MPYTYQDWESIIFKKSIQKSQSKKKILRRNVNNSSAYKSGSKVKDSNEIKKIKRIGKEMGIKIQQARLTKKMKQKDLAQRLNIQANIIQQFETGKAVYNGAMLVKIGKVLGVKLTGKNKKKTNQ